MVTSENSDVLSDNTENLNLNNMMVSRIEISKTPNSNILEIKMEELLDEKTRKEIENTAKLQTNKVQRYSKPYQGKELLYIVEKQKIQGNEIISYSYVVKDINKIILSQFKYLYFAIILLIIFMLYPAKLVANKITNPLSKLKNSMQNIASRDWTKEVKVEGSEEIAQLSDSCEAMRIQLVEHDKNHQLFLQEISHELKTPIMIINSYIQAIRDGMFSAKK